MERRGMTRRRAIDIAIKVIDFIGEYEEFFRDREYETREIGGLVNALQEASKLQIMFPLKPYYDKLYEMKEDEYEGTEDMMKLLDSWENEETRNPKPWALLG